MLSHRMRAQRTAGCVGLCVLLAACGARTDLEVQPLDAGTDSAPISPELCNGLDDDADGMLDEGIAPRTCGAGACVGTVRCTDGEFPVCVPPPGSVERCNGEDDDCDGAVDEDLGFGPLAPALEIREGIGRTAECGTCSWAWDSSLARIPGGWMAIWMVGISGGDEAPNIYTRRLDDALRPTGPVQQVGDEVVLQISPVDGPPAPDLLAQAVLRIGFEDVAGWLRVSPEGDVSVQRAGLSESCALPFGLLRAVWTGSRVIVACSNEATLTLASMDRDGSDTDVVNVELPGRINQPHIAARGDLIGVHASTFLDDLRTTQFLRLDTRGRPLAEPREVAIPYVGWARLLAFDDGFLFINPLRDAALRTPLSSEGEPLADARPFEDTRRLSQSHNIDRYFITPGGPTVLAAWQNPDTPGVAELNTLNAQGDVIRAASFAVPGNGFLGRPHARFDDSRVLLTWHDFAEDDVANGVFVQPFGCIE